MHRHASAAARGRLPLLAVVAMLWITGIVLWLAAPVREPVEALGRWHHPAFVVHLLLAWCAVFGLGRWAWPHVMRRGRGRLRRLSGWSHAAAWSVVALTGIGLQVLPEAPRDLTVAVHWWLGLALPLAVLPHLVRREPDHH